MYRIDERLNKIIVEGGPSGEGNLVYALVTTINLMCNVNLNPRGYILHHLDFIHSNFDIHNLILLPVYAQKNVANFQYKNANTAIHKRFSQMNIPYLQFLHNIRAIDVFASLTQGNLVLC